MQIRNDIDVDINNIMTNSFVNYTKNQYKKEEWNHMQMQVDVSFQHIVRTWQRGRAV